MRRVKHRNIRLAILLLMPPLYLLLWGVGFGESAGNLALLGIVVLVLALLGELVMFVLELMDLAEQNKSGADHERE